MNIHGAELMQLLLYNYIMKNFTLLYNDMLLFVQLLI